MALAEILGFYLKTEEFDKISALVPELTSGAVDLSQQEFAGTAGTVLYFV